MAVASSSNNLIAALSAPAGKPASRSSDDESAQFSQSLSQQMSLHKTEQAKAPEPVRPSNQPQAAKPQEQEPELQLEKQAAAETESSATPGDDVEADPGDDDAIAAAEEAQAALAGNAALLAQLRAHVDQGLGKLQAAADAGDSPLLKNAGLAKALLEGRADKSAAADAAALAADRQALPLEQAAGEGAAKTGQFAALLEQANPQGADAGARQIVLGNPRLETGRAQSTDHSKALYAINQSVSSTGWDRALGHKVVMMVSNQQQEVEMQLNPPNMGPIEVKLTLNQDQASLTFVAANAPVREALQQSMPRLQEMLSESGIQLGQVNVQARSDQGGQPSGQSAQSGATQLAAEEEVSAVPAWRARALAGLPGNVNLFV